MPGKAELTTEINPAEFLELDGRDLEIGSLRSPKYNIDCQEIIKSGLDKESDTSTERGIDTDGEMDKVNDVSNKTLIGLPLADVSEYLSGLTFCNAKLSEDASETGITSATDSLSGKMVTVPLDVLSWVIFPVILGVGPEIACDIAATSP